LIIVFASNLLNMSTAFAQDDKQPIPIIVEGTTSAEPIVPVESAPPFSPDTVYTQN